MLESLEHAERRGARILGEVLGYGLSGDAYHITSPAENGEGAQRAMRACLADGGIDPKDVGYINAHGTSTEQGDIAETKAVKTIFGPAAKKVAISSTKSALGHSLGASGGIELVITALALMRSHLPPTINHDEPDPECDLDYVPNVARRAEVKYAMSNSFGFGGYNTSLLIGKV